MDHSTLQVHNPVSTLEWSPPWALLSTVCGFDGSPMLEAWLVKSLAIGHSFYL